MSDKSKQVLILSPPGIRISIYTFMKKIQATVIVIAKKIFLAKPNFFLTNTIWKSEKGVEKQYNFKVYKRSLKNLSKKSIGPNLMDQSFETYQ